MTVAGIQEVFSLERGEDGLSRSTADVAWFGCSCFLNGQIRKSKLW